MAFGLNFIAINGVCNAKSTQDTQSVKRAKNTQSTKHTQSEQR